MASSISHSVLNSSLRAPAMWCYMRAEVLLDLFFERLVLSDYYVVIHTLCILSLIWSSKNYLAYVPQTFNLYNVYSVYSPGHTTCSICMRIILSLPEWSINSR